MKKVWLICALLGLMASPAFASKDEKLNELIDLAQNQALNSVLDPMIQQITTPIECSYTLDSEGKELLRKEVKKLFILLQMRVTNIVKPLYDENFSEAEIDELLTFYKSPTVQKMMGLAPIAAKESMKQMSSFATEVSTKMVPLVKQIEEKYPARPAAEIQTCIQKKIAENQ